MKVIKCNTTTLVLIGFILNIYYRSIEEQSVLSRQIILEGVPVNMALDRIQKHFPQCISALDYRDDPNTPGVVSVEFMSSDVVSKLCADAPEVKIDGATVSMFTYAPQVCKRYNMEQSGSIRSSLHEPDQFKPLNDDLRRDMCKAHRALEEERTKLFNRTDIFSQEKQKENARLCALMRPYREHLLPDLYLVYPVRQVQKALVEEYHAFLNDPLPSSEINLHFPNCVAALTYWVNIVKVLITLPRDAIKSLSDIHSSVASAMEEDTTELCPTQPAPSHTVCGPAQATSGMGNVDSPASQILEDPIKRSSTVQSRSNPIKTTSCTINQPSDQSVKVLTTSPLNRVTPPTLLIPSSTKSYASALKTKGASKVPGAPSTSEFGSVDFRYYLPDGTPRTKPLNSSSTSAVFKGTDSHFHLDLLSRHTKVTKFDSQLLGKLMPSQEFQYLVTSFCFQPFPSEELLQQIARDKRMQVCVGLHPKAVSDWIREPQLLMKLSRYLTTYPHVVAVGEVGLDYTVQTPTSTEQIEFLKAICRVALEKQLPIVVHCREANDNQGGLAAQTACIAAMLQILPRAYDIYKHCVSNYAETELWRLGFPNTVFGIGSRLLMKGRCKRELEVVVKRTPLSHMVLESDAPFLHPEGFSEKGKRRTNYPTVIFDVARAVASLKKTTAEQVLDQTRSNSATFFKLTP